jgi:hypothetical protein
MDDSERSYGYSRDIYHGRRRPGGAIDRASGSLGVAPFYPNEPRFERSYEYGRGEGMGDDTQDYFLSPEEAAIHIRGGRAGVGGGADSNQRGKGRYDYGTGGVYSQVESFTWDIPGPHSGRGPRGYRRSDERIHEDVCDRLAAHGYLDASDVEVDVEAGEVTLTGTVPDRRTKRLAEVVAEQVHGVADVHNRLRLAGATPRRAAPRREASAPARRAPRPAAAPPGPPAAPPSPGAGAGTPPKGTRARGPRKV